MKEITLSAKEYKELLEEIKLMQNEIGRLEKMNRELLRALASINITSKSAVIEAVNNKNIFEREQEQKEQQEQKEAN